MNEATREFKCIVLPILRLTPSSEGFKRPLCDTCKCKDCGNPIESRDVSFGGVSQKMKIYASGAQPGIVVACEGYLR